MGLYFNREDKEILNAAVTPMQIVDFLGIAGRRIGNNISILCPASDHTDHSYGNCIIYDQGRKCRCFSCNRSFSALTLLIEAGGYSYYDAMCVLASLAHMEDKFEASGKKREHIELPKLNNEEKRLIGIASFPKIKMVKGVLPERNEKKQTFRDSSGDFVWYETVSNPWVDLARDDPDTLNWMIQGKCQEKMTQFGLVRKTLFHSKDEKGMLLNRMIENLQLSEENQTMSECIIELEKQLVLIYKRFGGHLTGREMAVEFIKRYAAIS